MRHENAIKILGTLLRFRTEKDGLLWTVKMLSKMLNIPESDTADAIDALKSSGFIYMHNGEYLATELGSEHYANICRQSNKNSASAIKWKEELATGLRLVRSNKSGCIVSKPTRIESPVLPSTTYERPEVKTPEEIMASNEYHEAVIARIIGLLGISYSDFIRYQKEGRIKYCRGVDGESHIGVFDFHRKNKTLQHLCRKCRKIKRKGGAEK